MKSYIIDFERVNQLTMHPKDKESDLPMASIISPHGVSRKIIKDYLDIYHAYIGNKLKNRTSSDISDERFEMVCDTLLFNRILIDKRDNRIKELLEP